MPLLKLPQSSLVVSKSADDRDAEEPNRRESE
jgi:hypothetical protein